MITTSNGVKLKAFKNGRDTEDVKEAEVENKCKASDKGADEEKGSNGASSNTNHNNPQPTIVICQRDRPDNRLKARPRTRDDFRMARGGTMDRRGANIRSRGGGGVSRKVERENESNIVSGGKFQDSLSKGNASENVSSSKYYNDSEGSKHRVEFGYMVPEDSRISKLLRRLSREDDQDKFMTLCKQLQESLMVPENGRYIRRSLDLIVESLLDLLHSGPGPDAKLQAAKCLGRVGYVLEQDFKRYVDWVFSTYAVERNEDVRLLLMKAVLETLKLDEETLKLKEFSSLLMNNLQNALEYTDSPEFLIGTVDVILQLTEMYPSTFTKHFRDTVDILVGWHIDGTQKYHITNYASRSLQRLSRFWVADMQFSLTLLSQFLEDMEAYGEDLTLPSSGRSSPTDEPPLTPEQCVAKITSLIKVFNTVLKCLGQHLSPVLSPAISWSFLINCFTKMLQTVLKVLEIHVKEDLIMAANECACLLLTYLQSKTSSGNVKLYLLIETELSVVPQLGEEALISMLRMIAKAVREVSANLPIELVQQILGPTSAILQLRFSSSLSVQNEVVAVYQSLLNLKNIPPLQEAYRYVLGDLEIAYRMIVPSMPELCQVNPHVDTKYTLDDAEIVVMFHLRSLADLANASNSIIGMWALKPSILELLAVKLQPYDENLMMYSPALLYALLYLLYSHCARYNHFVSSSFLVSANHGMTNVCDILRLPLARDADVPATSPTSGHFSIILNLLSRILSQGACEEVLHLVLGWTQELLLQAVTYLSVLQQTPEFTKLINAIIITGHTSVPSIAFSVLDNLEQLLSAVDISWEIFSDVVDLCILHLNSTDSQVGQKVCKLLTLIPWHVTVIKLATVAEQKKKANSKPDSFTVETVDLIQRHHLARGTYGEIQAQQFRKFMGYLLQGIHYSDREWLEDMFCSCWPVNPPKSTDDEKTASLFPKFALASNTVLLLWATWEAAQFCVTYKLRTPLGKPQDTFTSIEGAIKSLARELSLNQNNIDDVHPAVEVEGSFWRQQRVRLLVEFVEHLEKATHNAAEGSATAMLPSPKPVRMFFHTNKSTCAEWLTRIRLAVMVVALHAGLATAAVRHGHCLLQDLVDANNIQGTEFERAVMYTCWALCKLNEPEAIQGLYAWCRELGRKFVWLKAAAEQACGKYEAAGEDYRKLLYQECSNVQSPTHLQIDENSSSVVEKQPEQHVNGFLAGQLTECYMAVNNWTDLVEWKEKEQELWNKFTSGEMPQKYWLNNMSPSQIKALAEIEENKFSALAELEKWDSAEKEDALFGMDRHWSCYKLTGHVYSALFDVAINLAAQGPIEEREENDNAVLSEKLEACLRISHCQLQEGLRNVPSEFLQDCAVAQYAATGLQALLHGHPIRNPFSVMDKQLSIDSMNTSVLTKILWWGKYFDHMSASGESLHYNHSNQLRMEVARKARKEGNFNLAQNLLVKIFGSEEGLLFRKKLIFNEVAQNLIQTNSGQLWNSDLARACMEIAKLLYSSDSHEKAIQVCAVSALGVMQQPANIEPDLKERGARTMLTLAKWLQLESHLISDVGDKLAHLLAWEDTQLNKDMLQFGSLNIDHCSPLLQNGTNVIPAADAMVGRLLHKSVSLCPSLAKCWSQFAAWCYRWGRRVVDAASETGGQLSEGDRAGVKRLLPSGMPLQDLEKVYTILSQTRTGADEEDIENEDINTSEMIESQLQNVQTLNQATSEQLTHLVDIWRGAQKRIYIYYELSAVAYFKYLELCGDKEGGDCATITATLRLLRLIVKHALELQEVLESGLGTTPTRPWKGIIPQLFSRLSHPEPYVRRRVSELLCRVAEDAPHLITFPAVVGAAAGGARLRDMNIATTTARLFSTCLSQRSEEGDLEDEEEEEEEEEEEDDECSNEVDSQVSVLKNCFLAMVDTLSKQAPDAISQVQLLVQELRRITLLWDELWLGTLAQHHAEISRRLSQLELEILKVDNNVSLSAEEKEWLVAEKHRIILKPLFFVLEQLHAITSVTPETPHEKWFQQKFGEYITDALQKLKHPTNPRRPQESWQPMKQLQSKLQQRAQKRGAYMIRMTDVSPALAALKDTLIAMPGINSHSDQIITVASVDNNIAILPTKTKPKKIAFHGCDGQMYTYLFKGLEDLHLDERIMQFLSIANTMMHQKGSSSQVYQARHYSVIPLGPRSGLISWVDGVTPLFGLYKRWQQREAALTTIKNQSSSGTQPSAPSPVMRPSELFYSKLTPYLKERGITNLDNRKEWPHAVLKQVLTELMEETPKDLLAKELWCHSINSGSWWQATRTYSYSVAVMSIIGYIIGLGDRHLDNVLVDLSTGEVVHIDYNVCFEKGKTLRVPEKVPFRMTPNICTALGVTGVEGIFRLACEHVLKIMKKGRETLLTLLEAFVYDPLIDWTPGNEAGYTGAVYGGGQEVAMETKQSRKELEREVTVAMFCVRVAEMKADWLKNRDELLAALPELEEKLSKWLKEQGHIKEVQEALQDFHQQMALVKEAEALGPSGQHPLYSLAARFSKHRRARDAQEKAKTGLREKLADCEKHLSLHKVALASVRGPQLAQWVAELNYPVEKDSHLVFDLVKEFLQNAGQGQMIMQCGQSECELGQLAQQQNMLIRTCLDLLSQYGAVAGLYPASYLNTHRSMCYLQWVQVLLGDMTVERCQEVRAQFQSIFSADALNNNPANQQIISFSYQLQGALQEANVRFKKSFERLTAEGLPESSVRLEAAYMEAREAITKFLHGEPGAAIALECVIITALCTLNKRLLMMEAAAASAGDCLVDLTSREGDWFLDEMYLVSTLVTELATLLPLPHNPTSVQLVLQCLKSANSIYKGLQELNFNFHTIILPEALKTIQTEEPTVLVMVQELDDIIAGVGCPLPELLVQLEMHLRFVIMEMESPHSNAQSLVSALRTKYEALLLHPSDPVSEGDETLKPGQMLLMGFNGLFEKLQLEGSALISALETLETPACWKKVDQVREAKTLAAPVFSDATRAVLEDIFLLKRLQTMQEFFLLCGQMTRCPANMHDDDQLNKPIRRFTADYVSRQLLGVTSQTLALALCLLLQRIGLNVTVEVEQRDIGAESKVPLEELCHKAVDLCLKRGHLSTGVLAQASGLTSSMEVAWRQREVALHLQQEVEGKRATLQRLQLQLTAYHWLYEDVLAHAHGPVLPLSRPSFMLELRKTSSALLALQARLSEAQEQQNNLVSNVEQRLKWAAGVNPALNEVMAAFESAVTYRNERLAMEQELAALVGNTCSALLHHEALRTRTSEAVAHDTAFLQLLDQCEKSCVLMDGLDQGVTAAEESLMQLLPPEGPIDHSWIQNAEILISDKVKTLQEQLIKYQQSLVDTQENLKKQVLAVRSLFSAHHKLMLEVRSLMKSMAKFEDGGLAGLHEYLSGCRMYSEQFSSVIRDLMADEIDVDRVHSAMEQLQSLKERTSKIYEELLLFGKLQQTGGSIEEKSRRPPLLRQESVCFSPRKGVPGQDPRTGKAVQERNAYALGVWRRVRMKLEGRDPDPGRRATVQEQVEYVIHEAMSLDNLALLYEGWTPWV